MSTDIASEVRDLAQSTLGSAQVLHHAMTGDWASGALRARVVEDNYDLDATGWDWIDLLNAMALEVYATARHYGASNQITDSVTVVTGTGGPHTEFTVNSQDNVTARAIWGSETAEKYDTLEGLFDSLAEIVISQ